MNEKVFDFSNLSFSKNDLKRFIYLPKYLSDVLAEEIGIFMGDGCVNIYNYKNRGNYWLIFTGNLKEEIDYYQNYVMPMLKYLYNYSGSIQKYKDNSFNLQIRSKAIVTFKINTLNLPFGKKSDKIFIPESILKNKSFLSSFIRGLADADFSLTFKKKHKNVHYYPVLRAGFKSKIIVEQLHEALKQFKISSYVYYDEEFYDKRTRKFYVRNNLFISGRENLERWLKSIGFNNPVHVSKFLVWKKLGFCSPHTTLKDRISMLNNEIVISKFKPQ